MLYAAGHPVQTSLHSRYCEGDSPRATLGHSWLSPDELFSVLAVVCAIPHYDTLLCGTVF